MKAFCWCEQIVRNDEKPVKEEKNSKGKQKKLFRVCVSGKKWKTFSEDREMGFSALQGKGVHEALLARQDAEIRLIETMRRCLSQKAKCDRDYAIAVGNVAQTGLKIDRGDDLAGKSTTGSHVLFPSCYAYTEFNKKIDSKRTEEAHKFNPKWCLVLYLFMEDTPRVDAATVMRYTKDVSR